MDVGVCFTLNFCSFLRKTVSAELFFGDVVCIDILFECVACMCAEKLKMSLCWL